MLNVLRALSILGDCMGSTQSWSAFGVVCLATLLKSADRAIDGMHEIFAGEVGHPYKGHVLKEHVILVLEATRVLGK